MIGSRTIRRTLISVVVSGLLAVATIGLFAQTNCPPEGLLLRVVDPTGKTGFIDKTGKIVIRPDQLPSNAVLVNDFSEGLAPAAFNLDPNNGSAVFNPGVTPFGYVDTTGRVVIKPEFDYTFGFCDGLAYVQKGEFQGYIDKTGKVVIDVSKDCSGFTFKDPVLLARCPRFLAYGYRFVGDVSEGLIAVTDGRYGRIARYGFHDLQGKTVIAPRFEPELEHHGFIRALSQFAEGLAKVKIGGKYGYVNKRGKLVIDTRFESASDFSQGLAFVSLNSRKGYINKAGKWVISLKDLAFGNSFSEGLAAVTFGRQGRHFRWGYVDRKGKMVIEPQFDGAADFKNGIARIYVSGGRLDEWENRFGYIDRRGRYIWKVGTTFEEAAKNAAVASPKRDASK